MMKHPSRRFLYLAAGAGTLTVLGMLPEIGAARQRDAEICPISQSLVGHTEPVHSATFSPDGKRVVTASDDWTARLWDVKTRKLIGVLNHESHDSAGYIISTDVYTAAFSPDGKRIVTASEDKKARLWDAQTHKLIGIFKGHEEDVVSAAFSPDGKRIVTASDDYTARLWDAQTHKLIGVLKGHKKNVSHAAFSPDGNSIVTASFDGSARLWDVKTRKVIAALNGHEQKVNSAAFSPDGKRIVTASGDGTARLWDAQTHKPIGKPLALAEGTVESVAFSPDGKRIVTGSSSWTPDGKPIARADADLLKEGSVQLWDAQTHKPIGKPLAADGYGTVASVAFSPDGNRIITASGIKAQLWRISRSCPQ